MGGRRFIRPPSYRAAGGEGRAGEGGEGGTAEACVHLTARAFGYGSGDLNTRREPTLADPQPLILRIPEGGLADLAALADHADRLAEVVALVPCGPGPSSAGS